MQRKVYQILRYTFISAHPQAVWWEGYNGPVQ